MWESPVGWDGFLSAFVKFWDLDFSLFWFILVYYHYLFVCWESTRKKGKDSSVRKWEGVTLGLARYWSVF